MEAFTFWFNKADGVWSTNTLPAIDSPRTVVLAFGSPEIQNEHGVFNALRKSYPSSQMIGCSTAGEIVDGQLLNGTLAVAVIRFEQTELATASTTVRSLDQSGPAAHQLAQKLLQYGVPRALLFFGDGVHLDQEAVAAGFRDVLGPQTAIFGAFAGDGDRFERPWVLAGDRVQSGLCVGLALYGNALRIETSSSSDWGPREPKRYVVTRSSGNIVYELNNTPALDLCQSPTGTRPLRLAEGSAAFHFTPIGVDGANKGVAYHQPVPEGSNVLLVDPDADSLLRGAAQVAGAIRQKADGNLESGGQLALTLSSVGRRLFLGQRAGDEITQVSSQLTPHMAQIGLYTYGGLTPGERESTHFDNTALSVVLMSEGAEITGSLSVAPPSADVHDSATRALPADYAQTIDSSVSGASFTSPQAPGGTIGGVGPAGGAGPRSASPVASGATFHGTMSGTAAARGRPAEMELGHVSATISELPTLTLIALRGAVDETFASDALAAQMQGRVVLDLADINKMTSFGVRGWLEMMSMSRHTELFFANCSDIIVNQMLMVRDFAKDAFVVSFNVPYICTSCSNSFDFTLDVSNISEDQRSEGPSDVACPDCGNRAVFDDDPESFFQFLSAQQTIEVPADVRHALADRRLARMTQVEEAVQKEVEGMRTTFRINRDLDEKIRWSRVLEGVEGTLRIDFSGSRGTNDAGIDRFLGELYHVADKVNEILLDQVNVEVAKVLAANAPIPNLSLRSVSMPTTCTNCGVVRFAGIDAVQIREAKRHGLQPESECRRCGASLPLVLPEAVVAYVAGGGPSAGPGGLPRLPKPAILAVIGILVVALTTLVVYALTR